MFESRYNKLNIDQKEAVDTIDGPVLVVAGPGTGKTELLSLRTANILLKTDISPSNILLLTFTESGAENMRERLEKLIGERAYKINVYTFHAFASSIISQYPDTFFEGTKFEPATEIDQQNILENIFKNLDRGDVLSSFHPELGFSYIRDVAQNIKDIKRGNMSPQDFYIKIENNKKDCKKLRNILSPVDEVSGKRKFEEVILAYVKVLDSLKKIDSEIAQTHAEKLEKYIFLASEEGKSNLLTEWKKKYIEKNEEGHFIFKEENPERQEKLFSLQKIYAKYQEELFKLGKFDFDDMILLVNKALKENPSLRFDLQERFQYIMIDEFQDTNDAQFQIALELTTNTNQSPNILAVGDDDQAIFKFQGAEINNIKKFLEYYQDTKVITLKNNYRSTQEILDFSRKVIKKGVERLENFDKNINKELTSHKTHPVGKIIQESFSDELFEFQYIAEEIKKILGNGTEGKEIAVICRKHDSLKKLAEFFTHHKIGVEYEKQDNILKMEPIILLVKILKFLESYTKYQDESLLPEILSFPIFNIPRLEIWQTISNFENSEIEFDEFGKKVYKKKSLLDYLIISKNEKIKAIGTFIKNLVLHPKHTPLPILIDRIIGGETMNEDNIDYETDAQQNNSFFKSYYFSATSKNYLENILAIKTFVEAIREFRQGQEIYLQDFQEFIDTYESRDFILSLRTPFKNSENAVQLLTAHKSKGLEFEYVFLLSSDDSTWKKAGVANKISMPINLSIGANKDNDDDKLRLLYVALTRAKHTLYITHSDRLLEYLVDESSANLEGNPLNESELSKETINAHIANTSVLSQDEKNYLKTRLENYKMPVTHFINFLNFPKVGPEKFIEQNVLRYPQAMQGSAAYGSAIHSAIEKYYLYFNKYNKKPTLKFTLENLENSLHSMRLEKHEFNKFLKSGEETLKTYIKFIEKRGVLPGTKVETKFATEGVVIQGAKLTGNLDKMEFIDNEVIVTDLKTGSQVENWEEAGLSDYEKTKMHFYKYQLAYYSILIENSINYSRFKSKVCQLEFVEPNKKGEIVTLPLLVDEELKSKLKKLINIVYKKIQNLDFPDTTKYSQNFKGILDFENDLLNQ